MTTALTTQQATGLTLQTFDDAFRFAKMVAGSEFAPKDFKGKPESCLLAIQHGSEVGLSPMQSLQSIAVINGRPTIWGDAALALVQSSPACEYVRETLEGEGKSLTAVCEVKRRGYPAPTIVRFSMADAEKAGLLGKSGPWAQYTSRMLALRARGFALRNAFADALRGLITAEEAQDYPAEPTREPLTKSVNAGNGIEVHHVASFEPPAKATPEATVYEKAAQSIARAKTIDRLDEIRRKVGERLADKSLTKWEHDELAKSILDKAAAFDSGVEHFDGQEVQAEAQAR